MSKIEGDIYEKIDGTDIAELAVYFVYPKLYMSNPPECSVSELADWLVMKTGGKFGGYKNTPAKSINYQTQKTKKEIYIFSEIENEKDYLFNNIITPAFSIPRDQIEEMIGYLIGKGDLRLVDERVCLNLADESEFDLGIS